MNNRTERTDFYFVLGISLVLGLLSLWNITEQDIFWQIRSGDEILRTFKVQTMDTWSYTAYGEPWFNIQWLAAVIMRSFLFIGGDNISAMIVLRAICVFLLFVFIGLTLVNNLNEKVKKTAWKYLFLLFFMELAYLSFTFRMQIRSEIFVFIIYAALIFFWYGMDAAKSVFGKYKMYSLPLAVVLSANLHAGVAPFVIGLCFVIIMDRDSLSLKRKLLWCSLCVAAIFINPYTYKMLPILYKHIFYASYNSMSNPDHQALSFSRHFNINGFSVAAWLFMLVIAGAVTGIIRSAGPYKKVLYPLIFSLFLILMAFNRVRAFPFAVIFLLPAALGAGILLYNRFIENSGLRRQWLIYSAVLVLCFVLFKVHLQKFNLRLGWGLNKAMYPVGSVEFIKKKKPLKNIYHGFAYGHYMDWNLMEYPVFTDTRETMFWKLQSDIMNAFFSPAAANSVYARYNINTVLNPIPETSYDKEKGFRDLISEYNPLSEWALVYFDNVSVLTVRRVPGNSHVYKDHEYRLLRPNLPPNHYFLYGPKKEIDWERYNAEIQMCRSDEPENVFCRLAQAAWWLNEYKGNRIKISEAKRLLLEADLAAIRQADVIYYYVIMEAIDKALYGTVRK